MSIVRKTFSAYNELPVDDFYFTGGVQPAGKLLQCLTGVIRLRDKGKKSGATHIIINTTGWIEGAAVYYKRCKIDALLPRTMVVMERSRELSPIISPYKKMNSMRKYFLTPSSDARERDREQRRANRNLNFERYFKDSSLFAFALNRIGISGMSFPPGQEKTEKQLIALVNDRDDHAALGIVQAYDSRTRMIEVLTPLKSKPDSVKRLHFENFRYGE